MAFTFYCDYTPMPSKNTPKLMDIIISKIKYLYIYFIQTHKSLKMCIHGLWRVQIQSIQHYLDPTLKIRKCKFKIDYHSKSINHTVSLIVSSSSTSNLNSLPGLRFHVFVCSNERLVGSIWINKYFNKKIC